MKRILFWVVIYLLGAVSGVLYNFTTSGAKDRSRIVALENELSAKNEKLDKCTSSLIEQTRPNAPPPTPVPTPK